MHNETKVAGNGLTQQSDLCKVCIDSFNTAEHGIQAAVQGSKFLSKDL